MYKPKHKKPLELKPNTKVIGIAASGIMLAAPLIQSASPVFAVTTETPSENAGGTSDKLINDNSNNPDTTGSEAENDDTGDAQTSTSGDSSNPDTTGSEVEKTATADQDYSNESGHQIAVNNFEDALKAAVALKSKAERYSVTSWVNLKNEISIAEGMADNLDKTSTNDIDEVTGNLVLYKENLMPSGYRVALEDLIKLYGKLSPSYFASSNDYSNYQRELADAKSVVADYLDADFENSPTSEAFSALLATLLNSWKNHGDNPYYDTVDLTNIPGTLNTTSGDGNANPSNTNGTTNDDGSTGDTTPDVTTPANTNTKTARETLQTAIDAAKKYSSANYTSLSFSKLTTEIDKETNVLNDSSSSDAELTTAAANINAAIAALVSVNSNTSTTSLRNLYDAGLKLASWDYTQDSWTDFADALTNVKYVLDLGDSATAAEVASASTYLTTAQSALVKASETSALKQLGDLYTQVDKLTESDFTKASWEALATAQSAADLVLKNGYDATLAQVNTAYTDLTNAVAKLVWTNGNHTQKTELTDLYDKVQYYAQGDVDDGTWETFTTARATAASTLKSDDSTVIDYMNAYDALNAATTALGEYADVSYIATASYGDLTGVGKVFFSTGNGVALLNKPNGTQVNDSDGNARFLSNGTRWQVSRQAILQDGSVWYEVGLNMWINAKYVMMESDVQVGQVDYLPDLGVNLWSFEPDGLHFTGRRLDNGSQWKMFGSMMINGQEFFNLGANQWVDSQYISLVGSTVTATDTTTTTA